METGRKKLAIGSRVKIKHQHWLRALEDGIIVEYRPQSRNNWLVKFERGYPGGGIDGDKLYFAEDDFLEIEPKTTDFEQSSVRPEKILAAANGYDTRP